MMQDYRFFDKRFESKLECLGEVEAVAAHAARIIGFDERDQQAIRLAVREAVINAIAHGNRFDRFKKVEVEFWEDYSGAFVAEIADEGLGFQAKPVRGRGLARIRSVMDEVTVGQSKSGARIHMVKYLRAKQA